MSCNLETAYKLACEKYAEYGVDVAAAVDALKKISLSIHAWQGDDVVGFENTNHALTGGCQVTGNYPGRARNSEELRKDLDLALSLIPGKHRVNLQGHQVDKMLPGVDRDAFTIENFSGWLDWAKAKGIGMDLAPAFYSHPKLDNGLSLSHPDKGIREFWINHGIACRKIGAEFGKALGTPCVSNFWAPDGFKDMPVDRFGARMRLAESLDACFAEAIDPAFERDAVEAKLFGIGTESCTVGSHATESIGEKLSAIFTFMDEILLHVSRGVRWDSDHVTTINDELMMSARESVAYGYSDKIHYALDYFDASINRVAAWVIGARSFQMALLISLLEPKKMLMDAESKFDFTSRLALQETAKSLPWGAVWEYFCANSNVPTGNQYMSVIKEYEKAVLLNR